KETLHLFLGVLALVMADEHDLGPADAGQPALDRRVIAEVPVAMQFAEPLADDLDIVLEQRALGMAGNLDGLPRRKVLVGFLQERGIVAAKLAKLFRIIHPFGFLMRLQLLDLLLELGERLLKLQDVAKLRFRIISGRSLVRRA